MRRIESEESRYSASASQRGRAVSIKRGINIGVSAILVLGLVLFFTSDDFKRFVIDTAVDLQSIIVNKLSDMFKDQAQSVADKWAEEAKEKVNESLKHVP